MRRADEPPHDDKKTRTAEMKSFYGLCLNIITQWHSHKTLSAYIGYNVCAKR